MRRPNFCSECGTKIIRLHWHPWTSRRFCAGCAPRLRKERFVVPLIVAGIFLSIGLVAGRSLRHAPPPLIIQRSANSPLYSSDGLPQKSGVQVGPASPSAAAPDVVYLCGARTKKGTPCSRRMHEPVRCWQHRGMPAMLPREKLIVKE